MNATSDCVAVAQGESGTGSARWFHLLGEAPRRQDLQTYVGDGHRGHHRSIGASHLAHLRQPTSRCVHARGQAVALLVGVSWRWVGPGEVVPVLGSCEAVGLRVDAITGSRSSRAQERLELDVVQEAVQARSPVTQLCVRVAGVRLVVTLGCVIQNPPRLLLPTGIRGLTGVRADLAGIQRSFAIVSQSVTAVCLGGSVVSCSLDVTLRVVLVLAYRNRLPSTPTDPMRPRYSVRCCADCSSHFGTGCTVPFIKPQPCLWHLR